MIFFGIGFFIYYKYYAEGTLEIISNTPDVNITLNNKDYTNTSKIKLNLEEGIYHFGISKLGYLDQNDYVDIHKLRKTKVTIKLTKIDIVSYIDNPLQLNNLITNSNDGLYVFDYINKKISKITEADNQEPIMDIDFLNDNTEISSLQWIKNDLGGVEGTIIKYIDSNSSLNHTKIIYFDIGKSFDLSVNMSSISYNSNNNQLAYIYKTDEGKENISISNIEGGEWKNILDVNTNTASNTMWLDNSHVLYLSDLDNQYKITIIDINKLSRQDIILKQDKTVSFFYEAQLSLDKENLILPIFDGVDTTVGMVNFKKQNQQILDINPYMNLVKWKDNNTILYISDSLKINNIQGNFTINSFDVDSGKSKIIFNLPGDISDNLTDFLVQGNEYYIVSNGQLMRLSDND